MHIKLLSSTALMVLAAAGIAALPVQAQTFNAANDFSATNNPNGVWSYGYRTTAASSSLTDYTVNGTFQNVNFWYLPGTGLPDVGHNPTSTTQGGFLPAGDLYFHPGDNTATADDLSVVRWTAPSTGNYQFNTLFTGIDTRIPNVLVYVVQDGVVDFSGVVSGVGATQSFNGTFNLVAGDTLDFAVGNNGSVGDHNFIQLDTTINGPAAVPEASTTVSFGLLLALGLGGVVLARKKHAAA